MKKLIGSLLFRTIGVVSFGAGWYLSPEQNVASHSMVLNVANTQNNTAKVKVKELNEVFEQVDNDESAKNSDTTKMLLNEEQLEQFKWLNGNPKIQELMRSTKLTVLGSVLISWASKSTKLASQWLLTNETLNSQEQELATMLVFEQLALKDFSSAIEFLTKIDPQYYNKAITGIAMGSKETEQFLILRTLVKPGEKAILDSVNKSWMGTKPEEMAFWISDQYAKDEHEELKVKVFRAYAYHNFVDAGIWLESNTLTTQIPELISRLEYSIPIANYEEVFDWIDNRPEFDKSYDDFFEKALTSQPEIAYKILSNSNRLLKRRERYLLTYRALLYEDSDLAERMLKENPYANDSKFIDDLRAIEVSAQLL